MTPEEAVQILTLSHFEALNVLIESMTKVLTYNKYLLEFLEVNNYGNDFENFIEEKNKKYDKVLQ